LLCRRIKLRDVLVRKDEQVAADVG
jgi:hypothetical protein